MKKIILILALSLFVLHSKAQDSLKYNYAVLLIDFKNDILTVVYNSGEKEFLIDKLNLSRKELKQQDVVMFRCLNYLNSIGYDIVSTKGDFFVGEKEYLFKKKLK